MKRAVTANLGAYLANGLALVITARTLGPSGRGVYAALLAWAAFTASSANLSLGPALAHAAAKGSDRSWLLRRFLINLAVLSSVGAVIMLVLLLGPLHDLSGSRTQQLLVITLIPSAIVCDWSTYLLQGLGATSAYSVTRFAPSGLNFILLVGVASAGGLTLTAALACFWVANQLSAAGVIGWLLTRRFAAGVAAGAKPTWRELWGFGAKAHIGTLASILNARLDLLVVSLMLPAAATGRYSVATSMTIPIAVVGTSLGAVHFADVARAGPAQLGALLRRLWRQMIGLTAPAAVLGVAASVALVVPLFGASFAPARLSAAILAVGTGGLGAAYLATSILQARGWPGVASRWYVVSALLSALTLLPLVPPLGITGAALSCLITYLIVGAAMGRASVGRPRTHREPPAGPPLGSTALLQEP